MSKKIMHITQSNGGVSRYLQMLFKYMDSEKYENILVYSKEYEGEIGEFENLVDKIELVEMYREINAVMDIKAIKQLHRIIKEHNPDIIYAHSSKAGALARILNIKCRKPMIYNPHGWAFDIKTSNLKTSIYRLIEKNLSKYCNKIIAISDNEKKSALKNKICSSDKIDIIVNGIDIKEFETLKFDREQNRIRYGIPINSIVLGMVGRISKQKAPDNFIKVAIEIKKKYNNAFFIIVGDGEDRKKIENEILKNGLEKSFLITGWVDNIYEYVNMFDIALLLSRWEGFGLAIAEYMISNIPIVSTNVGAIPELIKNNDNGLLVDVDDVEKTILAVKKILDDKDLASRLVDKANKVVKNKFDVKRVAMETEILIDQLI